MDFNGKLVQFTGMGIGCTLIHRSVFMQVPFRVDRNRKGHADSFFYEDLLIKGINVYVDTSVVATHKNSDWATILDNEKTHQRLKENKL